MRGTAKLADESPDVLLFTPLRKLLACGPDVSNEILKRSVCTVEVSYLTERVLKGETSCHSVEHGSCVIEEIGVCDAFLRYSLAW